MPKSSYQISAGPEGWIIDHEGKRSGGYELPEAAFEAVMSAASLEIKERRDVIVSLAFPERSDNPETTGGTSEPAVQRRQFDLTER